LQGAFIKVLNKLDKWGWQEMEKMPEKDRGAFGTTGK
jgi:hypothetical protein